MLLRALSALAALAALASPLATETVPSAVRIILVGDIMLSRYVAAQVQKAGNPLLPFEGLSDFLKASELNFGNLESPISGSEQFTPRGSMVFNAPPGNVKGLEAFNFRVVSLANNHALDQGRAGLEHTRAFLAGRGIRAVGAGADLEQAWQPEIVPAGDLKIGFLAASYSSYNDGGIRTNSLVARIEDLDRLRARVQEVKKQADFVIVAMHAGNEYTDRLTDGQVAFARAAIEAGAAVVAGSHPHCVQEVERYKNGLIFYSLGNFTFDQKLPETQQGLAVRLNVSRGELISAELHPIAIERFCCAAPAQEKQAREVLARAKSAGRVISLLRP